MCIIIIYKLCVFNNVFLTDQNEDKTASSHLDHMKQSGTGRWASWVLDFGPILCIQYMYIDEINV